MGGPFFPIDHPARAADRGLPRTDDAARHAYTAKERRASEHLRQRRGRAEDGDPAANPRGSRRWTATDGRQAVTAAGLATQRPEGNGEKKVGDWGSPFLSCVAWALFHVDVRRRDRHLADNI